jgi:hypothetical protein
MSVRCTIPFSAAKDSTRHVVCQPAGFDRTLQFGEAPSQYNPPNWPLAVKVSVGDSTSGGMSLLKVEGKESGLNPRSGSDEKDVANSGSGYVTIQISGGELALVVCIGESGE